jgi:GNAT superfamily N-acetyltransferase
MTRITTRPLQAGDSFEALTVLLNKAYAALAQQGWNFTAADQGVEVTRKRAAVGRCIVAHDGEHLIGTVMVRGPYRPETDQWCLEAPCYRREDTAILSQFAVDPLYQGQGLGERLMDEAEAWAVTQGYVHVALDTAKPAEHLQRRYARRGYELIGEVQWEGKTYRSVLMLKKLDSGPTR